MRVLVAGLYHETNTLLPGEMGLSEFTRFGVGERDRVLADGSPMAAMLSRAEDLGWDVRFAGYMRASPGPTVADEVLATFLADLHTVIDTDGPFDGVCLILHGAMVSANVEDVELAVLNDLRKRLGPDLPICGLLDLHANLSEGMGGENTGFLSYRENPHTDARAVAVEVADLLHRAMSGETIRSLVRLVPILWPASALMTAVGPMHDLESLARELERDSAAPLWISVNAGYCYADIYCAGLSVAAVTTGDLDAAAAALETLAARALADRHRGVVVEEDVAGVIADLAGAEGLTVIAEPADNIGGGAPGDCTDLLRALLAANPRRSVIMIADAVAAAELHRHAPGDRLTLELGGRSMAWDSPVCIECHIISLSDGQTVLDDPDSHLASMYGRKVDMGPSARIGCGNLTILVTSRKIEPFDLAVYRHFDIEPAEMACVVVKAAVGHRKAFAPIATRFRSVETRGPCGSDINALNLQRVRRPIFPIDAL